MSDTPTPDKIQRKLNGRFIDALTIDFWSTLGQNSNMADRRYLRRDLLITWFAEHDIEITDDEVYDLLVRFAKIWHETWLKKHVTLTARDAIDWLAAEAGIQPSDDELNEMARNLDDTLRNMPPVPVDGALDAVRKLAKEFPLALICDTGLASGRNIEWVLETWGVRDLFQTLVFSDAVGVAKPHPKMFHTASEALGIPRQRLVHIGDREDTDVKGAKSFGMAAIRFEGARDEILCGPCSMADKVIDTWDEIVAVLLGDDD